MWVLELSLHVVFRELLPMSRPLVCIDLHTLQALLSSTFLQTEPELALKEYFLSPRICLPKWPLNLVGRQHPQQNLLKFGYLDCGTSTASTHARKYDSKYVVSSLYCFLTFFSLFLSWCCFTSIKAACLKGQEDKGIGNESPDPPPCSHRC